MDVTTNGHTATHPDDEVGKDGHSNLWRALGVVAFLVMGVWWIWVFTHNNIIAHPDDFNDATYSEAAEAICEKRQAAIAELPLATAVESPQERSTLVTLGTEQLELMVAELGQLSPPAVTNNVERWLSDYQIYLQDRRNYSAVLASGESPPFTISGNTDGVRVTDLLRTFAEVNRMESCAPSGDA